MNKVKDWKRLFWDVKLERGMDYYVAGRVRNLKRIDYGYKAVVDGFDKYEVRIYSKDGEHIDEMYCDCPDFGEGHNCKHLAAMLYEIEDYQEKVPVKVVENQLNKDEITTVIDSLSEKQVKDYLKKIITSDYIAKDFKMEFIDQFEDSDLKEEIIDYYDQFKDIYDEYYYEDEFDCDEFTNKSEEFMKKISKLIKHNHLMEAFDCIQVAVNGVAETKIEDGFEYDICLDYINLVSDIINQNDNEFNNQIFTWALKELEQSYYDSLAETIFEELACQEQYYQQALKWSNSQLSNDRTEDFILKFKYDSLNKEEIPAFVEKYNSFKSVKELYLADLIESQDYLKAIDILKELRSEEYYFRRDEYTKKIIELYQKLQMDKEAITEAKNRLYQRANLTRYNELKKVCGENWLDYRDEVLNELKKNDVNMLEYYHAENMVDELYQEAKNNYYSLYQYRETLKVKYHQELTEATIDHVFSQSKEAGKSGKYYDIAREIVSLLEYGNDQSLVNDIVNKLCLKYSRRRTFIKILNSIVK